MDLSDAVLDYCNSSFVKLNQYCFSIKESTAALRLRFTVTFGPVVTTFK